MLLRGEAVSKGLAVEKAYIYKAFTCDVHEAYIQKEEAGKYRQLFEHCVDEAEKELDAVIASFSKADEDKAKIFVAHKEILRDEEIIEMINEAIVSELKMPDYAVDSVFAEFIEILGKAKDPLIAARTADLRDVRNRIVRVLHGEQEKNLSSLPGDVIVVAHDLLPSDTATIDRAHVKGIITEVGGATSHSAIIARSFRIPAVLGVPDATKIIKDTDTVALDALAGEVHVAPNSKTRASFAEQIEQYRRRTEEEGKFLDKEPLTADGARISLGLNVGSDKPEEGYAHCDFVGLFRTEFLYMQSDHMPTEEEQLEAYKNVLSNANGKPVTLRTLDIGGDKTLKYMELPQEPNPFLGARALRLCLAKPAVFRTQLRAALRASAFGELQLMFPMVGTMDDFRKAKAHVDAVKDELRREKKAFDEEIKLGIMIEIPSIALMAQAAASECDFASVGTNDLCQYLFACDRMNPAVSAYADVLSPAMLRALGYVADSFNAAGKPLSVCGEMGGDPDGAVMLAGLGYKKLSMSASGLAPVKAALASVTLEAARELAKKACGLTNASDVRAELRKLLA